MQVDTSVPDAGEEIYTLNNEKNLNISISGGHLPDHDGDSDGEGSDENLVMMIVVGALVAVAIVMFTLMQKRRERMKAKD